MKGSLSINVRNGDVIQVGENIEVTFYKNPGPKYTIKITAPKEVKIVRGKRDSNSQPR